MRWLWVTALGVGAWSMRNRIAARIPGTAAHLARRAARSTFLDAGAQRLVAAGIPDDRSVRIWLRTDRTGDHVVELRPPTGTPTLHRFVVAADPATDGTAVVRIPGDVGEDPLAPNTRYGFEVRAADGTSIGEGQFTTAPRSEADTPDRFAVAIASCHQPFDDEGNVRPVSLPLLDALGTELEHHGVRALLLLGDQVYADLPAGHSLFDDVAFRRVAPPGRKRLVDCTRAEVRSIYQHRYRAFWKVEAFARLQARFPTLCMLDDHEIIDNFGSDPLHATEEWAELVDGALDAFHDYQGLRAHDRPRPPAFPTRFAWGPLAGLVLDVRSQRRSTTAGTHVMGETQWAMLDAFLDAERARPVLMLGLTVPLLHAPQWLVAAGAKVAPEGSALHEQWSHPSMCADRDRLVHRLLSHRRAAPEQRVILVSGDVHAGTVSEITFDGALPMLQVVSSAVSNLEHAAVREGSAHVAEFTPAFETASGVRCAGRLLPGVARHAANPYAGLNAGIIELFREGGAWHVRVRLVGYDGGEPVHVGVVYESNAS